MRLGVPREIKPDEYRVGLPPTAVREYVTHGHEVIVETSRPTTHKDPTYTVDGVVHYCVANMPGAAPRTSSEAFVHATLPFGLQLADQGLDALKKNKHLAKGLNVLAGEISHPAVAEALGKPFKDPYGVWLDA